MTHSLRQRIVRRASLSLTVLIGVFIALQFSGVRCNLSPSVPRGLYWVSPAAPNTGAYVAYCPPAAAIFQQARGRGYLDVGLCPGGTRELLKVLVAQGGDQVSADATGIHVNGVPVPDSVALARDSHGRPLPQWRASSHHLNGDEVVLMSERCPRGFDARYFGPQPKAGLRGTAHLLLRF